VRPAGKLTRAVRKTLFKSDPHVCAGFSLPAILVLMFEPIKYLVAPPGKAGPQGPAFSIF